MNDSLFCQLMEYTDSDYNNTMVKDDRLFLYWECNHFHFFTKEKHNPMDFFLLACTLKTKYWKQVTRMK